MKQVSQKVASRPWNLSCSTFINVVFLYARLGQVEEAVDDFKLDVLHELVKYSIMLTDMSSRFYFFARNCLCINDFLTLLWEISNMAR